MIQIGQRVNLLRGDLQHTPQGRAGVIAQVGDLAPNLPQHRAVPAPTSAQHPRRAARRRTWRFLVRAVRHRPDRSPHDQPAVPWLSARGEGGRPSPRWSAGRARTARAQPAPASTTSGPSPTEHLLAYAELLAQPGDRTTSPRSSCATASRCGRSARPNGRPRRTGDIDRLRADSATVRARPQGERNRDHRETSRASSTSSRACTSRSPSTALDPAPAQRGRLDRPGRRETSAAVPRWLKLPLVVLLAAVEVPIHFESFRAFTPAASRCCGASRSPSRSAWCWGRTWPGVWLRRRHTRPAVGVVPTVASGALMAVWLAAAFILADLRRTMLVTPPC